MATKFTKIVFIAFICIIISTSSSFAQKECFEKTSRAIFKFNQGVDNVLVEPVAKIYNKLPQPIKNGAGNFTSNIGTLLSIPNYLLQGDIKGSFDATGSFLINSTIGFLGLGNPASQLGFKIQKEDVGQTLGVYGVKSGCYFVLPILGPTTVRDSVGMIADTFVDPFSIATWREKDFLGFSGNKLDYVGVKGTSLIDFRGKNVENFESLEKNSIDLYSSIKSIYLQNRKNLIANSSDNTDDDWGNLDN